MKFIRFTSKVPINDSCLMKMIREEVDLVLSELFDKDPLRLIFSYNQNFRPETSLQ